VRSCISSNVVALPSLHCEANYSKRKHAFIDYYFCCHIQTARLLTFVPSPDYLQTSGNISADRR